MSVLEKNLFDLRKKIIKNSPIFEYLEKIYPGQSYPQKIIQDLPDLGYTGSGIEFWQFFQPKNEEEEKMFNIKYQLLIEKYKKYRPIRDKRAYATWGTHLQRDYLRRGKLKNRNVLNENNKLENNFAKLFLNQNENIKKQLSVINRVKETSSSNSELFLAELEKEKELETEKIHQLLNKRSANLEKCGEALLKSAQKLNNEANLTKKDKTLEVANFFFSQSTKEKWQYFESIYNRINRIKLSKKDLNFNKSLIDVMMCPNSSKTKWNETSFNIFKEILKHPNNKKKIFLLGRLGEGMEDFLQYRQIFYVFPCYEPNNTSFNSSMLNNFNYKNSKDSCIWSYILNYFSLYMIKYSKNDFSSIIILPDNNQFPKRRESTSINSLNSENIIFLGFLMIPYMPIHFGYSTEGVKYRSVTREIFICVFLNKEKDQLLLYTLDLKKLTIGQIYADFTVLYDELKGLFTYLNKLILNPINAYYNESISNVLFLSTKPEQYIYDTYNFDESSKSKYGEFQKLDYSNSGKQIKFHKKNNKNTLLLESINNTSKVFQQTAIELGGGNKNNVNQNNFYHIKYLNKILFVSRIMLFDFNIYLVNKYSEKISKKYNLQYDIMYTFLFKNYSELKLIRYDTKDFFLNNKFSFGWSFILQVLYSDLLNFNKNKKICEISVQPCAFEILNNCNVDLYYTNNNYDHKSPSIWIERINEYKTKTKNANFIYHKKEYLINKKYNIMIINLIKNLKGITITDDKRIIEKNNISINYNYVKYSVETIIKYVKKQLPYLEYIKIGGDCYFAIHNLLTQEIINIYYKICTLFENVELYCIKYEDVYRLRFGGSWLKCYNKLKIPQKIDKKILFKKVEQFNYNIYNKMIQQFYDIDRFIEEKLYHDSSELEARIFNMQLDTAINFCKEYNLKISPKWKKIIKDR
jgi:hypothetical protein